MEKMALAVAIKKFLMVEGEKLPDVLKQIKSLTPEDKEWFRKQFPAEGICEIT